MSRLQRVLNGLWMTVLISALFHWVANPDQGYMLLTFLVRLAGTAVCVYFTFWVGDTFKIRRRRKDDYDTND